MKQRLKVIVVLSLLLAILFSDISSMFTYANSQKSETIKIELNNVTVNSNKTYTYDFTVPKDFGELVDYTFNATGEHTVNSISNVSYNAETRKLSVTFLMNEGNSIEVKGYKNDDFVKLPSKPYNMVCRYSDGARWQINEYSTSGNYEVTYRNVDLSSYNKGKSLPYEFVFDVLQAVGKTRLPYENANIGYWVDGKGNVYNGSQIDATTKRVKQSDVSFPSAMLVTSKYTGQFTEKNPVIAYRYTMVTPNTIFDSDKTVAGALNPSSVKPTNFMSGHAKCQQYEHLVEYIVTANTKPAFSINGTFTYRYETIGEPKVEVKIKAEPDKVQFKNEEVIVNVTLEANVYNISDPKEISHFVLYLRTEDGTQMPQPLGYKVGQQSLSATVTEQFKIPTSKLDGKAEFTEFFVGRAYAYLATKKYGVDYLMSDLVKTHTLVYKNAPEPPPVEPNAPVAIITGQTTVKKGDYVAFDGYKSFSPNGEITGYRWALERAEQQPPTTNFHMDNALIMTWYSTLGQRKVVLYVIDELGLRATDFMNVNVVEPTIEAYIKQSGTLKENRKVTFTANIDSPHFYPVIDEKIKWTVKSLTGDQDEAIKYSGTLDGQNSIDVLFKEKGEYLVTLYVENTAGYTYETNYIANIKEDLKPVADFEFQQKVYRDPQQNNVATFELTDYSYSYDGDKIAQRLWSVIFDANNDGIFNESPIEFRNGNETKVTYTTTHVGKYKFILEVVEEFGEPTIEEFVTSADRRRKNTTEW